MKTTFVQAICCEVSDKPGVAHVTSLHEHLPEHVKCLECGKEYSIDYNSADLNRIVDYANRLVVAGREAIGKAHPHHGNYMNITEIEGEPLATVS